MKVGDKIRIIGDGEYKQIRPHGIPIGTELPIKSIFNKYVIVIYKKLEWHVLIEDIELIEQPSEAVNHPQHYGGVDNPYEAIKIIEAHNLDFCSGNVIKYVLRSDKKGNEVEDLKKAVWYLNRKIEQLSK